MTDLATRSWKYRRRLVYGVTGAACAGLAYLIGWGSDTDLHRQIAGSLGTIIITVIAVYVGGATADDALKDRFGKGNAHDESDHLAPHGRVTYAEHD